MASCWSDTKLLDKTADIYLKSNAQNKTKDTFIEILKNIEGYHGDKKVVFGEILSNDEIEAYAKQLDELAASGKSNKEIKEAT